MPSPDTLASLLAARDKEMEFIGRGYDLLIEDYQKRIVWLRSEKDRRLEESKTRWNEKIRLCPCSPGKK